MTASLVLRRARGRARLRAESTSPSTRQRAAEPSAIVVRAGSRRATASCAVLLCDVDVTLHSREEAEIREGERSRRESDPLRRNSLARLVEHGSRSTPVALGGGLARRGSKGSPHARRQALRRRATSPRDEPAPGFADVRVRTPEALESRDRAKSVLDPCPMRGASRALPRGCRTRARACRATLPAPAPASSLSASSASARNCSA